MVFIHLLNNLGNHEQYPNDQFDTYNSTNTTDFLKTIGDIYKPMIGDEAYETFIKKGFYTLLHPGSNLRIVSLNCFLCDNNNFYLIKDPTDPYNQVKSIKLYLDRLVRKNLKTIRIK